MYCSATEERKKNHNEKSPRKSIVNAKADHSFAERISLSRFLAAFSTAKVI